MSNIIKAPNKITCHECNIFLAGSIEMDTAENWQEMVSDALKDIDCNILNPRRDEWDSSWKQDINNKQFNEQVNWELDGLECADIIVMYFDPNTKSPITLLELGLFAKSKKIILYCPDGFWRKGNVDIICQRYKIKQVYSFQELILTIKSLV